MRRTFIAIDIKKNEALTGLIESYKMMLKGEKIKWVDPSNIHLTLAFLGEINEDQVNKTGEIMDEAVNNYSPFEISFDGTGVFRDMRKPRVIWLGIKAPESLYDMRSVICKALGKEDLYHDEKLFRPHLTLGRIKYIAERKILADMLSSSGSYNLPSQIVNELILYESILKPEGPVYNPLKKARLIKPGS
ncbi:MAG: RNA 2',3'-cyclic phosphodiesterase [Bacteroidales bacterium]|nr:RNA 2',3'-cyclic phosphodiesterase [Bacteroidales bacterium]